MINLYLALMKIQFEMLQFEREVFLTFYLCRGGYRKKFDRLTKHIEEGVQGAELHLQMEGGIAPTFGRCFRCQIL